MNQQSERMFYTGIYFIHFYDNENHFTQTWIKEPVTN